MALRDGLLIAWNHGSRNILCELDCRELVNILKLPYHIDYHAHALILQEVSCLLRRSWRVELFLIYREGAVWLAKKGSRAQVDDVCLIAKPPSELEVILLKDELGI